MVDVWCGGCPILPMVRWMSGVLDVCVVDVVQSLDTIVFITAVCACWGISVAVTKFQKSCEHTVSLQLRASEVNVGFENFLQHFCFFYLGQSKCKRKKQLLVLPSFSVASIEHQVM